MVHRRRQPVWMMLALLLAAGLAGCAGTSYYGGASFGYPYRYRAYDYYGPYPYYYYGAPYRYRPYPFYRPWPRPYFQPYGGFRHGPRHYHRHR